jgi:hypothetical protein
MQTDVSGFLERVKVGQLKFYQVVDFDLIDLIVIDLKGWIISDMAFISCPILSFSLFNK